MNVETLIQTAPVSTMVYGRFKAAPLLSNTGASGGAWQTGLFIREDEQTIQRLSATPVFALRAGLFELGRACAVVVMCQPLDIADTFYESFWNWHGENKKEFHDMAAQDRLPILFYSRFGRRRSVAVNNAKLKAFFAGALKRLNAWPLWSMREFDDVKEKIYGLYPDNVALWDNLKASA